MAEPIPDACSKCDRLSCVCSAQMQHKANCAYLAAVTCPVAIECDHGFDVCPKCDPCTCRDG